MPQLPTDSAPAAPGGPGSTRARLRLGAVLLLGLLAVLYLALAIRLYFFTTTNAVTGGLLGLALAAVGILYGLLTRAVFRQSRVGHIVAIVVCAAAAVLSIVPGMAWPDWLALGTNAIAFVLLLGCVPRRAAR
nr:hypothetical protein [Propionicimonas sp.]